MSARRANPSYHHHAVRRASGLRPRAQPIETTRRTNDTGDGARDTNRARQCAAPWPGFFTRSTAATCWSGFLTRGLGRPREAFSRGAGS
eukprot:813630-Prymnesium_polylepis.1